MSDSAVLPVFPICMYKMSINPIMISKIRLINHARTPQIVTIFNFCLSQLWINFCGYVTSIRSYRRLCLLMSSRLQGLVNSAFPSCSAGLVFSSILKIKEAFSSETSGCFLTTPIYDPDYRNFISPWCEGLKSNEGTCFLEQCSAGLHTFHFFYILRVFRCRFTCLNIIRLCIIVPLVEFHLI
jgi:hypothetical protein